MKYLLFLVFCTNLWAITNWNVNAVFGTNWTVVEYLGNLAEATGLDATNVTWVAQANADHYCDGTMSKPYTNIDEAISTGSKTVFVGPGVYTMSRTMYATNGNFLIKGTGKPTVVLGHSYTNSFVTGDNGTLRLEGLVFIGTLDGDYGADGAFVNRSVKDQFTVSECVFSDITNNASLVFFNAVSLRSCVLNNIYGAITLYSERDHSAYKCYVTNFVIDTSFSIGYSIKDCAFEWITVNPSASSAFLGDQLIDTVEGSTFSMLSVVCSNIAPSIHAFEGFVAYRDCSFIYCGTVDGAQVDSDASFVSLKGDAGPSPRMDRCSFNDSGDAVTNNVYSSYLVSVESTGTNCVPSLSGCLFKTCSNPYYVSNYFSCPPALLYNNVTNDVAL